MHKDKTASAAFVTRAGFGAIELRSAQEGESIKVAGYAAVFNAEADIGGYFIEKIAPGAFDDVLDADVRFLINHAGLPLARSSAGNLRLSVDQRGLYFEADLDPADPDVVSLVAKIRAGTVREMSFAFRADKETWDETGETPVRTINHINAFRDVSAVTYPAYAEADIALRCLEAAGIDRPGANNSQARAASALRRKFALALS